MAAWRVATALDVLLQQINAKFPNRSKASDGSIGDASHASRGSDHNPWVQKAGQGIVTARDFTHDPLHGLDSEHLAECLRVNRDPRLKFIISNRKICSFDKESFKWRPYTGKNAHNHHVHVSVRENPELFDSDKPWNLDNYVQVSTAPKDKPHVSPKDVVKIGTSGDLVKQLQTKLFVTGMFDRRTEEAVKQLQETHGLVVDGIVGPTTWDAVNIT